MEPQNLGDRNTTIEPMHDPRGTKVRSDSGDTSHSGTLSPLTLTGGAELCCSYPLSENETTQLLGNTLET